MKTYQGANAQILTEEQELRRSVLSCLLWEDTFYEDGKSIAERIFRLSKEVDPKIVASLAIEAREKYKLRSVPLLITNALIKNKDNGIRFVRGLLNRIIQRPDEIYKFLELYWQNGKTPIAKQVKLGLADSFKKFNEYQLAKWNRGNNISLRDVMFLTHPKPENEEMAELWKRLASNELSTPDTWEVNLSASGADGKETWTRMLNENKLGALALLRNLRNMINVEVDYNLIKNSILKMKVDRVLPYRFITANNFSDSKFQNELEIAMFKCIEGREKINGKTILLIDVSGSMYWPITTPVYNARNKNDNTLNRIDFACGLSILLQQLCENVEIFTFSDKTVKIPDCSGFNLSKQIMESQDHSGTYMGKSINEIYRKVKNFDRFIVITDEQSHDNITTKIPSHGYIFNVAPYQNSIEHGKEWTNVNGFSEAAIDWMIEYEKIIDGNWTIDKLFTINWE